MTKFVITDDYIDVCWSGDELPTVLKSVQEAIDKYGPLSKISVGNDYDGLGKITIEVRHLETDEEEELRENRQAATINTQLMKRKQQYELLKKEFDGQ